MDDYIMYILVNDDLKMSKGKIGAQIGHVVEMITNKIYKTNYLQDYDKNYKKKYQKYLNSGSKKIILKSTQKEMEIMMNYPDSIYIIDAGKTQVPVGSMTVMGFYPDDKNKEKFKIFKLL
jgi:peptidyl-tRNA hydrolase, PTH2 family